MRPLHLSHSTQSVLAFHMPLGMLPNQPTRDLSRWKRDADAYRLVLVVASPVVAVILAACSMFLN